jgi:glycine cleavage system H protein
MIIPNELKYSVDHEWVRVEADGALTVGITDYARELLGDVVYADLPEIGRKLAAREACVTLESVKAAAEVYAPIAGTIVAVNASAGEAPENINQDAYAAWLFRLAPDNAADVDGLLDAVGYQALIDEEIANLE